MTDDEKWAYVAEIIPQIQLLTYKFESAHAHLMIAPESPLIDPAWRFRDLLINSLEKLVDDKDSNISWFIYDCSFGLLPKEAGYKDDMKMIDSVERLRWLCELG